jgi:hypothetical protein
MSNRPKRIPLSDGKTLVHDSWPYEDGNWRGESWRLVHEGGDHCRVLDEFESDFVEATIEAML